MVELGDLIISRRAGRQSSEEITLFESQGMAIQDLAIGLRILAAARQRGLGVELPMP
jgi:ornithine cyclodeaminase